MAFVQLVCWMFWTICALGKQRFELAAENLACRQQLASYRRQGCRPLIGRFDRALWALFRAVWPQWSSALVFVQPATVIGWHRRGFRLFWAAKSRAGRQRGRPPLAVEMRRLIRRMSAENPTWGSPRIVSELALLGNTVDEDTVLKYMVRRPKPPSQNWRTFLRNHGVAACDLITVPTATFRVLYVMVVITHDRRRVAGFHVTEHPSAEWAAQQVVNAFPFDEAPRHLLRDNDGIYGQAFRQRIASLGIEELTTSYRSPWQNPYCERVIGTLRRECLDHLIIFNERHLRRLLSSYLHYYPTARPHLSLDRNAPFPREVEPPELGTVRSIPLVGGLHHRYTRRAA